MNVVAWCGIGVLAWTGISAFLAVAVGRTVTLAEEHRPHGTEPAQPSHMGV